MDDPPAGEVHLCQSARHITTIFFTHVCVGVFVAQSIRVEAYLPQHVSDELDRVSDNRSEFIREAVKEKLDKEGKIE